MSDQMLELLEALVAAESPSSEPGAVARCGEIVATAAAGLLGQHPDAVEVDGRTHLRWTFGSTPTRVALIGHLDTVWPLGTIDRWPFAVDGDRATGPGAFDMKAGIVQGLYALAGLDSLDGVALLLTADEEVGSPTSRQLVEETAAGARAALILEPSAAGRLKTARKGVSNYEITVHGLAAHAGLEPERGANATVEVAHQIVALTEVARPELGTTVTPTVLRSGQATNVVPAHATLHVDVRASSVDEQERVDEAVRGLGLRPRVAGTRVEVGGGLNRPPLEPASSAGLFAMAKRLASQLDLPEIDGVGVGGGSDGNFTAALGVPTLDGLGAVGDGAHAEGEHVIVSTMAGRSALVGALVSELRS
jgi:glutamate carboxypeptidase